MKLLWVDTRDLRPGARPLIVTERDDSMTRINETTLVGSEARILGPSVLRFDADSSGLARVWIETDAEVELDNPGSYR